jgi:SsrA-binding protein
LERKGTSKILAENVGIGRKSGKFMSIKIVCQNKKARHDYFIDDVMEAGMVLLGAEVKSLRDGRASLVDSYARIKKGEVFLYNMHITPYPFAHHIQLDPTRPRKLLLHKKEIKRLIGKTEEKGYTLVPTKVYFSRGKAKVELALAKGKRKYDKRRALKEKEMKREVDEAKKRNRY